MSDNEAKVTMTGIIAAAIAAMSIAWAISTYEQARIKSQPPAAVHSVQEDDDGE